MAVLSSSILYTCGRFGILYYSEFQSLYLLIRTKISGYVLLPKNLFYLRLQQQIFTTLLSPFIHSFSLLFSISESHESRLEETEVETKGSLGKRLWKRIKKQQLYSHDRVLTSEWKAVMLDQKTMTKNRVGRLEKEKEVPETRAEEAERREPKCVQVACIVINLYQPIFNYCEIIVQIGKLQCTAAFRDLCRKRAQVAEKEVMELE